MSKKARAAAELLATKYPKQHAAYLDMQNRAHSPGKESQRRGRDIGSTPWRIEVQRRRRLAELKALMQRRYGVAGVDDEAEHAHIDIVELARHAFASAEPIEIVESAVKHWCRGCSLKTISNILKAAQVWKRLDAVSVGRRMMLTARERGELGITTIRAADESPLDEMRRQRERKRRNRDAHRRRRGAQTRDEYAWASLTHPWQAFGISRRTWERRGKPPPYVLHGGRDASASPGRPEGSGKGGDTLASTPSDGGARATLEQDAPSVVHHAKARLGGKAQASKSAPCRPASAPSSVPAGGSCTASTRAAVAVKHRPLRGRPGGDTTAPVLTHDTTTWGSA